MEELSSFSFPKKSISPECEHPVDQICLPCMKRSLQAQLDGLITGAFTCPLCKMPMSDRDVQRWAKPKVFHRYKYLQTRRTLAEHPNFIWCSNPRCEGGQVHAAGAASPIMTCKYCHARTCFTHQRPWHEGSTCYEFDHPEVVLRRDEVTAIKRKLRERTGPGEGVVRAIADKKTRAKPERLRRSQRTKERRRKKEEKRREERARLKRLEQEQTEQLERLQEERRGEAYVRRTTKVCPGGRCGYRVYKIGGCSHMFCSHCHNNWCWNCGQRSNGCRC
ncbi:hypothetical protein BJX76DRAFT_56999 [Aspergillus varians]